MWRLWSKPVHGTTGSHADDVDQSLVQVLDQRGRVVASSSNIEGEPPIATMQAGEVRIVDRLSIQLGDDFVLVAEPATTPDEVYLVLVARSLREVQHTTHVVGAVLAVAVPFLVLVVGLATWLVTGRALRPVEQMRLEVAAIGDEQPRSPDPSARRGRRGGTTGQHAERDAVPPRGGAAPTAAVRV